MESKEKKAGMAKAIRSMVPHDMGTDDVTELANHIACKAVAAALGRDPVEIAFRLANAKRGK